MNKFDDVLRCCRRVIKQTNIPTNQGTNRQTNILVKMILASNEKFWNQLLTHWALTEAGTDAENNENCAKLGNIQLPRTRLYCDLYTCIDDSEVYTELVRWEPERPSGIIICSSVLYVDKYIIILCWLHIMHKQDSLSHRASISEWCDTRFHDKIAVFVCHFIIQRVYCFLWIFSFTFRDSHIIGWICFLYITQQCLFRLP